MNCTEFRDIFDSRDSMSLELKSHLESCPECEIFADEERDLNEAFAAMTKVNAPGSFGFDVKSGIAKGKGAGSSWLRAARIALPAAAMLLIVVFVVSRSDLFGPGTEISGNEVAQEKNAAVSPAAVEEEIEPDESVRPQETVDTEKTDSESNKAVQAAIDPKTVNSPAEDKKAPKQSSQSGDSAVVGSIDFAAEVPDVINPPGIDPDRPVTNEPNGPKQVFTVIEVLKSLGISAIWKSKKLVVVSVADKSVAEKSGILSGDQITAIDGKKVSEKAETAGTVSGRSLSIVRAGARKDIAIGSN